MLSSILLLAAVASNPPPVLLRTSTAKSLDEFGSCFARMQEQAARPWAFIPNDKGGVFTDYGASVVAAPYRLQVRAADKSNDVQLFATPGTAPVILEAVNRCR